MKHKMIIIAEAGVNHNGSIELAKQLVDAAADVGADFVKFQSFKAGAVVSKNAKKSRVSTQNNRKQRKPVRYDQTPGTGC